MSLGIAAAIYYYEGGQPEMKVTHSKEMRITGKPSQHPDQTLPKDHSPLDLRLHELQHPLYW